MGERILVTGGAGFIGSHVAAELLRRGHEVWILDDLSGGSRSNVPASAHLCVGSILDRVLIDELFHVHRFAYVFHLAAYAAEGLSHFIKHFNYENNLIGSVNELAHDVAEAMGVPVQVVYLERRKEVQHAYSSHDRLRQMFGDGHPVALAEGLGRMAVWARKVGARQSSAFGEIEIARNLPPSWLQKHGAGS
jgi:nucleoside-diphosphate-sugar epimerase